MSLQVQPPVRNDLRGGARSAGYLDSGPADLYIRPPRGRRPLLQHPRLRLARPSSGGKVWQSAGVRGETLIRRLAAVILCAVPLLGASAPTSDITSSAPPPESFNAEAATRFAELALTCVHQEYPNKIAHVLNADADVRP